MIVIIIIIIIITIIIIIIIISWVSRGMYAIWSWRGPTGPGTWDFELSDDYDRLIVSAPQVTVRSHDSTQRSLTTGLHTRVATARLEHHPQLLAFRTQCRNGFLLVERDVLSGNLRSTRLRRMGRASPKRINTPHSTLTFPSDV